MKKTLFFTLLFWFLGFPAQNLSLNELIKVRSMDAYEAADYLQNTGWSPEDVLPETGILQLFYRPSYNYTGSSETILYKYYSPQGNKRLVIYLGESSKYYEYLNNVRQLKLKQIADGRGGNIAVQIFRGATTTFIFKITDYSDDNSNPSKWMIAVYENNDFVNSEFSSLYYDI